MSSPDLARIAPISRRAIGYLIDAFIATALAILLYGAVVVAATLAGSGGMLGILVFGGAGATVILLAWFLVYTLMQSRSGSVGMRAQGLRLVAEQDDARLGFPRTLLRNVVFGLACSVVVGYVTPLFDGSGRFQGWHDRAARSLMLDARASGSAQAVAPAPGVVAAPTETPAPRTDGIDAAATPRDRIAGPLVSPVSTPATSAASPPQSAPSSMASSPEAVAASASAGDGGLIAYVPGVTRQPPTPAPTSPPPPAPLPASVESDLDQTVVGVPATSPAEPVTPPAEPAATDDIDDTRISIPGHRLVFTWDDGTRVSVSRPTVFGRNPSAPDGVVAVPVRDETLSLSKTHFEAAAEPSGGWIVDRHSTNGTTLVRGGERIACPPGQRVPVRLGDVIEIGDRVVTIGGYA